MQIQRRTGAGTEIRSVAFEKRISQQRSVEGGWL